MIALAMILAIGSATPQSNEAQLAQCAWQKAATSSATLLAKAKFDRRYVYDADGSPTVGPLMRIKAACDKESGAFPAISGKPLSSLDERQFLEALRRTRPDQVGSDLFDLPVYRCEISFLDAPLGNRPAGVIWGYGSKETGRELESSYETQGVSFSTSEVAALVMPGRDPTAVMDRLAQIEPVRVSTIEAGKAAGKPFAVDPGTGRRACKHVLPDGSYTDA